MIGPQFTHATATTVRIDGRTLLSFAGCNYLGLAQHAAVLDAARSALTQFGISTSASRSTSGHTSLHAQLEHDIADLVQATDTLLLPDGYTANLAALQTLAHEGLSRALLDARAHRSLFDAANAAGLAVETFATADPADAKHRLTQPDTTVVLTDGVFTTDGRIAPLAELHALGATLLVDDCHGFGVVGPNGCGTPGPLGLKPGPRLIITSTLAKGLGCAGGFLAGTDAFVRSAREHASAFICTTPTSPALVAAAIEALRIARQDTPRREQLQRNIARTRAILTDLHLHVDKADTPIFAFAPAPPERLREIASALTHAGVYIPLMAYPNGPAPLFFRLSVNAEHTLADLETLRAALKDVLPAVHTPASGVPSIHAR